MSSVYVTRRVAEFFDLVDECDGVCLDTARESFVGEFWVLLLADETGELGLGCLTHEKAMLVEDEDHFIPVFTQFFNALVSHSVSNSDGEGSVCS